MFIHPRFSIIRISADSKILESNIRQSAGVSGMWKDFPVKRNFNTPLGLQNHLKGVYHKNKIIIYEMD